VTSNKFLRVPGGRSQEKPSAAEASAGAGAEPARQFTELYEQHFDFVWRSARMLGAPPDLADDAVQDVFLVAHRRFADFEARSSPRTWLFAITLRVMSDQRRSRRRRFRLLERAKSMEGEPIPTPYDGAASAEARAVLRAALGALPEEQQIVFALSELEEMSAPEIATALGVKLNTVYSRLRAARREIAERLRALQSPKASP
jgi:RNA polymerase sigma-70 factor (ECF subfamily)